MKHFLSLSVLFGFIASSVAAKSLRARDTTSTKPAVTESNEDANCNLWYLAVDGDTCLTISQNTAIPLNDLFNWNPALKNDCFTTNAGEGYCIGVSSSGVSSTTSVAPTSCVCVPLRTTITVTVTAGGTTTKPVTTTSKSTTLTTITSTKTTTTSIKTTTTTTTTTTTQAVATFTPEQFPASKGLTQCIAPVAGQPTPKKNYGGNSLTRAIGEACTDITGGTSAFLAPGDPYTASASEGSGPVSFQLKIWIGGFAVTNDLCVSLLGSINTACTDSTVHTYGGCAYTSDKNLEACIFP
ncbi:hypothetical protein TWF694_011391 [Orbilia ellipsospora]|uniref:LysM domain-containing protein n=1 Tax=Orbilia ellipsospora TaxID=2528407 RepID=A0AAV9X7P7_9PEZI